MSIAALVVVLVLNLPEYWRALTPWNIWSADYIAQGAFVALAPWWTRYPAVCVLGVTCGLLRTGCEAIWPNASDPGGSICDAQTGLPLTLGVTSLAALYVAWRYRRE